MTTSITLTPAEFSGLGDDLAGGFYHQDGTVTLIHENAPGYDNWATADTPSWLAESWNVEFEVDEDGDLVEGEEDGDSAIAYETVKARLAKQDQLIVEAVEAADWNSAIDSDGGCWIVIDCTDAIDVDKYAEGPEHWWHWMIEVDDLLESDGRINAEYAPVKGDYTPRQAWKALDKLMRSLAKDAGCARDDLAEWPDWETEGDEYAFGDHWESPHAQVRIWAPGRRAFTVADLKKEAGIP